MFASSSRVVRFWFGLFRVREGVLPDFDEQNRISTRFSG
jgi:hypothetical protein